MKAYNCKCLSCGEVVDRIVKSNEVILCSVAACGGKLEKLCGPIGGDDILPVNIGEQGAFVPFFCKSLARDIKNKHEMAAAYNEMYGIQAVVSSAPAPVAPAPAEAAPVDAEDEDDDEDFEHEDDEAVEAAPAKKSRGRPKGKE